MEIRVLYVCPSGVSGDKNCVGSIEELLSCVHEENPNTMFVLCSEDPQLARDWIGSSVLADLPNIMALSCSHSDWLNRAREEIPQWSLKEMLASMKDCELVDVRGPDEFYGPLSHIEGAKMHTLGVDFDRYLHGLNKEDLKKTIVFICRSGIRSMKAAQLAQAAGVEKVVNFQGGMVAWNEAGLPTGKKGKV